MKRKIKETASVVFTALLISSIGGCSGSDKAESTSTESVTSAAVVTTVTEETTSEVLLTEETSEETIEAFKIEAQVGDLVEFGSYAEKSISWMVLDETEDKYLLLSEKGLASKYMDSDTSDVITWEECELRQWLNGDFYNDSFSEQEKNIIATVTNVNIGNEEYDIDGGNDTEDMIFLLSLEEVENYFSSESERVCYPTDKAISDGCYVFTRSNGGNDAARWWTRTAGNMPGGFRYVECEGGIPFGGLADNSNITIRPAVWVNK